MIEAEKYRTKADPRLLSIDVMQLPKDDSMVAEKDREEKLRAIGSWILDFNGTVRMSNRVYLIVRTLGGEMTAMPGDWVVKHSDNTFSVWKDSDFRKQYTKEGS